MFSSANSVCVGTNHSQSFQSHCLSIRWLGIVTDTKMQSSQFRKEISSQFLLKFDHDSSQHSGTGKAFRPAPHTSKPSRSSRVVNQSIWNDFTAGNCSETILTSARKKIWRFADFYWFASRDAGDNCSGVIGHPHQKNPTKYYP